MKKDLTNSNLDRQNVLNNEYALGHVKKQIGMNYIEFEGKSYLTKKEVAVFFDVSERTIDNIIEQNNEELVKNGYVVMQGNDLKNLKFLLKEQYGNEKDFVTISKTSILSLFDFRAFLNIGMLLKTSENAQRLRSLILDVVFDVMQERAGGSLKYINQRDPDFLITSFKSEIYKKEFIDSLTNYVAMGNFKYTIFTDKIYKAIFKENAKEYRDILKVHKDENLRNTMYIEILNLIASFETEIANRIKDLSEKKERKLSKEEVDDIFDSIANLHLWKPLLDDAREKMASRDFGLRGVIHNKLTENIKSLNKDDFEKFVGEKSKTLDEQIKEARKVLERMKDK